MRIRYSVSVAAALLCTSAWPSMALAQEGSQELVDEAAAPARSDDRIVVTGSRVSRQDFQSESPIVTVGVEAIQAEGPGTIEAVLNDLPQFAPIRTGSALDRQAGGINSANLRGLGVGRTLVLLDGRRMQPSGIDGRIDLNSIPKAMISNVEVITGGASAAYGSDAVAGVVNIRLNTNFDGLRLDGEYGISDEADAKSWEASVAVGSDFADDRGRFIGGISYLGREFTPRGNRSFFDDVLPSTLLPSGVIQPDGTNLPSQAALNAVFARYGFVGNMPRNATLGVNPDGSLFTASTSAGVGPQNLRFGDPPYYITGGRVAQRTGESIPLQSPMDKFNVFGHVDYQIADWISAYGQFMYVHFTSEYRIVSGAVREPLVPITNPFIPADMLQVMASRPNPQAPLIYWWGLNKLTGVNVFKTTFDLNQGVLGLEGDIPGIDWNWDLYASYGRTNRQSLAPNVNAPRLAQLVNAADGGRSVCPGGFDPFAYGPLSADPNTAACAEYLLHTENSTVELEQKAAELVLEGKLFDLPAGEVRSALGASYRRNEFIDRPDALLVTAQLVAIQPGQFRVREGSDEVSELFAELLVPVLSDLPLIQELSLNGAVRVSDYTSIGTVTTYKASAEWQVFDPLRVRGGFNRAIRAPDLDQLFPTGGLGLVAIGQAAQGGGDPCDVSHPLRNGPTASNIRSLCLAEGVPASIIDIFTFNGNSVPFRIPQGAPLTQETAETYTVGVVLESPFDSPLLSNLRLSVDYYNIKLTDAIGQITAPITINLCYNFNGESNSGYASDNLFCQQIDRDAGGRIIEVRTPQLNLAAYETDGFDLQLDWSAPLESFGLGENSGRIALNIVGNYSDNFSIQTFAGDRQLNYAGTIGNRQIDFYTISRPKWRLRPSLTWRGEDFSATFKAEFIPSMSDSLDVGATNPTRPGVDARSYYDFSANWDVTEDVAFRFGILNLFDTEPPILDTIQEGTDTSLYDILGRRFNFGITKTF